MPLLRLPEMVFLDDIAALQFWRTQPNPRHIMRTCPQTCALHTCPSSREQLEDELARVPSLLQKHMMVSDPHRRFEHAGYAYTVTSRQLPQNSFYIVADGIAVACPELMFMQLARKLPVVLGVKLGYELCGTYSPARDELGNAVERRVPLASARQLRDFCLENRQLPGSVATLKALPHVLEASASAMETDTAMLMTLPRRYGGFALPCPLMNHEIAFDDTAARIAGTSCARADMCWPNARLDVEYDSETWHNDAQALRHDKARTNALVHMGYTVIAITRIQYASAMLFEDIVTDIAGRIGHRMRTPSGSDLLKRCELRRTLDTARHDPLFSCEPLPHLACESRCDSL